MENYSMHWERLQYLLFDNQYHITAWLLTCLCLWAPKTQAVDTPAARQAVGQALLWGFVTHWYELAVVRLCTRQAATRR
jgi:hypothetical protein